jgi:hypothetical protein
MELDITDFFKSADPHLYSSSVAELGRYAGKITWNNACNCEYNLIDSLEKKNAAIKFIRSFGAWEDDEINSWSDNEINALIVQFISGDMREHPGNWEEYESLSQAGQVSGRCFESDGRIYYTLDE